MFLIINHVFNETLNNLSPGKDWEMIYQTIFDDNLRQPRPRLG